MNNIKFRQYIKNLKSFHYWGYENDGTFTGPMGKMDDDERESTQFTGLKDKNGKKIFVGDFLDSEDGGYFGQVFWDDEELCFMCGNKSGASTNLAKEEMFYDSKVEIIGNKFENPELLEKEE